MLLRADLANSTCLLLTTPLSHSLCAHHQVDVLALHPIRGRHPPLAYVVRSTWRRVCAVKSKRLLSQPTLQLSRLSMPQVPLWLPTRRIVDPALLILVDVLLRPTLLHLLACSRVRCLPSTPEFPAHQSRQPHLALAMVLAHRHLRQVAPPTPKILASCIDPALQRRVNIAAPCRWARSTSSTIFRSMMKRTRTHHHQCHHPRSSTGPARPTRHAPASAPRRALRARATVQQRLRDWDPCVHRQTDCQRARRSTPVKDPACCVKTHRTLLPASMAAAVSTDSLPWQRQGVLVP